MILRDTNPTKYSDNANTKSDRDYLVKTLGELFENNIFYIWKYRKRRMFIMERDIGCWKTYNIEGCVAPKSILKITALYSHMLNRMEFFIAGDHMATDRIHMENDFGRFLNLMIKNLFKKKFCLLQI